MKKLIQLSILIGVTVLGMFLFWYGGLEILERGTDQALALTFSLGAGVAAMTFPGV